MGVSTATYHACSAHCIQGVYRHTKQCYSSCGRVCIACVLMVACLVSMQVAEVFTGTPGKYVPLENTIKDFKGVLEVRN